MSDSIYDIWDLNNQTDMEERKHTERVKEAIKSGAKDIINSEDIITSDSAGKKVKVRIPTIKQRRFIWGTNKDTPQPDYSDTSGEALGEEGDVLKPGDPFSQGQGPQAGNEHGDPTYTVEIDLQDIIEEMIRQLGLPNLREKEQRTVESIETKYNTYRPTDTISNADIEETILRNIIRNAAETGKAYVGDFKQEDLVKISYEEIPQYTTHAAVYLLMDVSGSMTEEIRVVAKMIFFWIVQFLKYNYKKVDIYFIAHDTQAWFEEEKKFFEVSWGGGTICSSALKLADEHIDKHHPPSKCNNYIVHLTDGGNWGDDDNRLYVKLVDKLLTKCSMIGYGEINPHLGWGNYGLQWEVSSNSGSELYSLLRNKITDEKFQAILINGKEDVDKTLQFFFGTTKKEK